MAVLKRSTALAPILFLGKSKHTFKGVAMNEYTGAQRHEISLVVFNSVSSRAHVLFSVNGPL